MSNRLVANCSEALTGLGLAACSGEEVADDMPGWHPSGMGHRVFRGRRRDATVGTTKALAFRTKTLRCMRA